ncbi:unnamed protein product [Adineta steineri]|uniref:Uncharacterized protein n=1 Tax=Adineta steineri TaxID=433720 RepID=A0A813ZUL1_9BILA|nr:unnamed protein product [Adineta steineri]
MRLHLMPWIRLPANEAPKITLYAIEAFEKAHSPDNFQIMEEYTLGEQIGTENGDSSIKKFSAPKIKIEKGQYLGIRFPSGAGNPFSAERNQYYCYFDDETYHKQPLQFTRCWTKGIAMSFHVQPKQGSSK